MVEEEILKHPIKWNENEIYVANETQYIFRPFNTGGHKRFINNKSTFHESESEQYQWASYKIRKATLEEKQWYLECEKHNKFIEFKKITSIKPLEIW